MTDGAPAGRPVVVWGNCQAAPLASLLRAPLARCGLDVLVVPPVYLATPRDVERVRVALPTAAALVSHPVRDEYPVRGCGTEQLARLLPSDGRLVRVASCYDLGPFPWLANAHGGDGARVDAPVTAYHDLRIIAAAILGAGVDETLRSWTQSATAASTIADESLAELRRREAVSDVPVSAYVRPAGMWTLNHPTNAVLGRVAQDVLRVLDVDGSVEVPAREHLGATRAPGESTSAIVLGRPATGPDWTVGGRTVPVRDVVAAHRAFYAARPDVVADARRRFARRLSLLSVGSGAG